MYDGPGEGDGFTTVRLIQARPNKEVGEGMRTMTGGLRRRLGAGAAAAAVLAMVAMATSTSMAAADELPSECGAASPHGPVWVTPDCVDPLYARPIIDRQTDESLPVVHHRVSGHFDGTDIQFNIYLPPADEWQGRFFQYTYPAALAEGENLAVATDRAIGFAIASGGYAVQAGNTGVSLGYRHGAAAAKFAEAFAADYYRTDEPIFGYLYGPSGGSFQTLGAMENTSGVWDGFVPMVQGVPMSAPYTFFIRSMARLILEDKAGQISDALSPGGSGDPYAGLDAAEQAMLRELTSYGVPIGGWENPEYLLSLGTPEEVTGFAALIRGLDPTYADDFWSKPGYLGTEQSPLGDAVRAALTARGGTDEARWDIALRSYYRHQLPAAGQGWIGFDQFRAVDGTPLYPQRAPVWGPLITGGTSGNASFSGALTGKVIVVDNLYDVDALPWHADWYGDRVRATMGEQAAADTYRVYYNDHADHLDGPVSGFRATYLVNYYGMVEQALRYLASWVEDGVEPPASTQYEVENAQVIVPDNVEDRLGIQPTVDLAARSGSVRIEAGQQVTFRATLEAVPGTGTIVATAWDFEGDGTYDETAITNPKSTLRVSASHRFDKPGVYFVALRATAQHDGVDSPYAKVQNLDRVRVEVTGK